MTTQTTAITLTGSGVYTNAAGNTVITYGAAVINNGYTSGITQTFTNAGTVISTGTAGGHADSGIEITVDTAAGQNNSITNSGLISAYGYGIYLGGGHASSPVDINNTGSIISNSKDTGETAGIFAGIGATVSVTNAGYIAGSEGVFLQTDDVGVQVINNLAAGTIVGNTVEGGDGYKYAIKIQDITNGLQGTGNIYNAGLINGFIDDAARYGNITNASTGTITEGLLVFGTGTLTLDAGEVLGGKARFADGRYTGSFISLSSLILAGGAGTLGNLADPGNFTGFGTVTVATGADWTLGTATSAAGFAGVSTIANFGTVNLAGALTGNTIDMEGTVAGLATKVEFTGTDTSTPIVDYGVNDQIVLDDLPSGAGTSYRDTYNTATGVLTVTEYNAAGTSIGSDLITVSAAPGTTIAPTGSFLEISGPGGPTIVLGSSSLGTSGSIYIDNGNAVALTNTTAVDTIPVTFGPHGSIGAFNTLDINGSVAGTTSPYQGTISGFGLNDDIIIGPSTLPGDTTIGAAIGDSVSLSYAGSLLTVSELSSSGAVIATTTLDVGTGYATNSFVAVLGTNGINIETPQTVDEQGFTLVGNGSPVVDFTDPTAYAGSLSPGDSIVSGETVTVASSPAVIVGIENPEVNSGTIVINGAQVIDAASATGGSDLTGTGTVAIENGGFFQQNGGSTSNTIAFGANTTSVISELSLNDSVSSFASPILGFGAGDEIFLGSSVIPAPAAGSTLSDTYNAANGQLVISETNATGTIIGTETLDVASGGSLTSGSFVLVSGPSGVRIFDGDTQLNTTIGNLLAPTSGSIVIDHGQQVTLANTTGVDNLPVTFGVNGTSLALNVLDLNGTVAGTTSPYQGSITGFGLNDDIILGPSVLPSVASGDSVTLSYTGSLLTVTELNSAGASIGSTTLNVGTGYAANSFVALLGTSGVNIESPQTVDETPLTFNTSGTADFETAADYTGGLAPGSSIVTGETVIIASGTATVSASAPVTDSGTIIVSGAGSAFVDTGTLAGTGTLDLASGGAATIAAPASLGNIDMGGNGAGTMLDLLGNFAGPGHTADGPIITNFGTTDSIVLNGFTSIAGDIFISFFQSGILSLAEYNTTTGTLDESALVTISAPGGAVLSGNQVFANFGPNGLVITDMPCFAAGTRILTPEGQIAVENLAVGDKVLSARDHAAHEIVWVGSRTVDISRHALPDKVVPVLIKAGAFGEGLPERDLRVSPDHALFIDGHLIEAKTLVNGATILRDRAAKIVTYHHVELASHDVVLAEGLPAETYLDSGNRQNFETDAAPLALHPDFAAASRAAACADLLLDGDIVRATRQDLLNRAFALGFRQTDQVDLVVKTSGDVIEAHRDETGRELMFVLPADARTVTLASATGVPAEHQADPSDRRVLGAAITGIALIAGGKRIAIDLHGPHHGFHDAEPGQRWTNGNATITLPAYTGRAVLEVMIAGQATRWQAPATVRQFVNG